MSAAAARGSNTPRRPWWRRGLRLLRDAAIGIAMVASLPLAYVGYRGDDVWEEPSSLSARLRSVERLRPLMLPRDGTLSASDAGRRFRSLAPPVDHPGFRSHPVAGLVTPDWKALGSADAEFASLRVAGGPFPRPSLLISAAKQGLTPPEMAYLRSVAESPVWNVVDELVRERDVDLVGGRFRLPFGPSATVYGLPAVPFAATKQLAQASAARAAYHVAGGDVARAEHALRVAISYGFLLLDNGSQAIDGSIGAVMVEIGREGLHELWRLSGNAMAQVIAEPVGRASGIADRAREWRAPPAVTRARLLADVRDPSLPRTHRHDALRRLAQGTCGSVRGVLFGHPPDVAAALRDARRTLARFPAEVALIDLVGETPDQAFDWWGETWSDRAVLRAARLAEALTGNPRVVACTQALTLLR